jgi:hypothetical protein
MTNSLVKHALSFSLTNSNCYGRAFTAELVCEPQTNGSKISSYCLKKIKKIVVYFL